MPWKPLDESDKFPTLGWSALDWIYENLTVHDGPTSGQPLQFTQEQADFILRFYEVDPTFTGSAIGQDERHMRRGRLVRRALLSRSKGWGKSPLVAAVCLLEALGDVVMDGWDAAGQPVGRPWKDMGFKPLVQIIGVSEDAPLALDTPVRTPTGWTTIGDVHVGDYVLDSAGQPVRVTRETEVITDATCSEVLFSDGERIVASEGHGWTGEVKRGGEYRSVTMNTRELRQFTSRTWEHKAFRLPIVAIHGDPVDLPIDPYVFGFWLGCGAKESAEMLVPAKDYVEAQSVIAERVQPWEKLHSRPARVGHGKLWPVLKPGLCVKGHEYVISEAGRPVCEECKTDAGQQDSVMPVMRDSLSALGVIDNKHIPQKYMLGSYEQRMDVLHGLMDSNGLIRAHGQAAISTNNLVLAGHIIDLLCSLGQSGSLVELQTRAGYEVRWRPHRDVPAGKLARTVRRQAECPSGREEILYRTVRAVNKVPTVPVKCIGIDTPDHLFLAGKKCVPTHNTANTFGPCLDMARYSPVADNYAIDAMETFISVPRGRIQAVTSAALSREGFRPVFSSLDQTESWFPSNGGVRLYRTVRRNTAKTGGSTIETPNAFEPGAESVAEATWDAYQQLLKGKTRSGKRDFFVDHREAAATTDIYDEASLRRGLVEAYGDSAADNGGWVNMDNILDEFWDVNTDPQEARRYFLNQITHASDSFLSSVELAACVEPKSVDVGTPIVLGFDGSTGRAKGKADATALVACRLSDGYCWQVLIREPPSNPKQAREWTAPVFEFDTAVQQMFRDFKVVGFYADPSGWEAHVSRWEELFGKRLRVRAGGEGNHPMMAWPRGKTGNVVPFVKRVRTSILASGQARTAALTAANGNKDAMRGVGEFTYCGSMELTAHLLNARMRKHQSGFLLAKDFPESPRKIDGAYALVLAWKARLDAVARGLDKQAQSSRQVITLG